MCRVTKSSPHRAPLRRIRLRMPNALLLAAAGQYPKAQGRRGTRHARAVPSAVRDWLGADHLTGISVLGPNSRILYILSGIPAHKYFGGRAQGAAQCPVLRVESPVLVAASAFGKLIDAPIRVGVTVVRYGLNELCRVPIAAE